MGTNAGWLVIEHMRIKIPQFSYLKMSSANCLPFCLCLSLITRVSSRLVLSCDTAWIPGSDIWEHLIFRLCWIWWPPGKTPYYMKNSQQTIIRSCDPRIYFTNDFSSTIQIWWKFHLAVTQLLVNILQQSFAHGTTAQLLCHVQNFVAIT